MPEQFKFSPYPYADHLDITLAAGQTYRIDALAEMFEAYQLAPPVTLSYTFTLRADGHTTSLLIYLPCDFMNIDDWALYRRDPAGPWVVVKRWEVEGSEEIWQAANGPSITG